jgi:hypothetical protein
VDAEYPGAQPGADREGGDRPLGTLADREAERLADEVLVRDRDQHRPACACELAEPPRHLQGLPGVLAEVVGGIHQDGVLAHPLSHGPFGMFGHVGGHVAHDIAVPGPVRPGPRRQAAGVRADQPGPVPGRYHGQPRIRAAPGVVEQVSTGLGHDLAHLGAPGVDADHHVRMPLAHRRDQARDPVDLGRSTHLVTRAGLHPADVDDLGPVGHRLAGGVERGAELGGGAALEE